MLVHALEEAKPGDRIVVASFGQGCDALCFEVTEHIQHAGAQEGHHVVHWKTGKPPTTISSSSSSGT